MKVGDRFSCKIMRTKLTGKIQEEGGQFFLCQNKKIGIECDDKLGYKYSWRIHSGNKKDLDYNNVSKFRIIGEITMNNTDMIALKRKVNNLSNGWDKEANELIAQIPMDISIKININNNDNNGNIIISPKHNFSQEKTFSFGSGECDKNKAFKKALNYILDLCWNEIDNNQEMEKEKQEEIIELKENIGNVRGNIDDIKHELSGIDEDKNELEDELTEEETELNRLLFRLEQLER